MRAYGLIGHPLGHSFSKGYFNERFEREGLDCHYENYDLEHISLIDSLLKEHPNLKGFNVTVPYKEAILPYLMGYEESVSEIKAVNTVKVLEAGMMLGYNTDVIGFKALLEASGFEGGAALILGTGGASKAVQYVLRKKNIDYHLVSRDHLKGNFTYDSLTSEIIEKHPLIINATPLGTYPKVEEAPLLPYEALSHRNTLIDLVYNPSETALLRRGKRQGAKTLNGLAMLHAQAEASWKIWNDSLKNNIQIWK